jgi:hypothetical protein
MSEHSNLPDETDLVKCPFSFVTTFLQVPLFNERMVFSQDVRSSEPSPIMQNGSDWYEVLPVDYGYHLESH